MDREVQPSDEQNTLHSRQCVKDTVDKLRSDARQESKTKLNMEDSKVPCRGLPEFLGNTNIGLKRMGELDPKAFHDTCKSRFPPDEAEIQATTLCLSWQENLKNLDWHPIFRRN
ncbi:hypothetical protein ES319_A06G079700v1 [Gossypium barbadense]|nr:factor of DNA methylation 1-like [Gossypium arboreum]XP_052885424.1 factor of DNA methylation 1-like [Gossypium arboreum]XP_052885425.1 factor of DNA methylation 1-like [Gossypium arboreum]XP_052885426.1 factor of DNA methylation 1-like [Gossypium arboreum]KAB2077083.1 hypothetical protein ES319_A06G079700v1 [Gossypium barbadense]TYH12717.1 hypothetical protein ES288_A06G089300v1 [Gossypium darwinii]